MKKEWIYWLIGSAVYFFWFFAVVGGRNEHIFLWLLAIVFWFFNEKTRLFLKNIAVWLFYWMLYDSLRVAPNWSVNAVHIQDLYEFDKKYFGVFHENTLLTLNEWCALHTHPALDLLAGAFYISWVPLPLVFAVWLYRNNRPLFLRFSWCFFVVNLIGFAIYYIYPAAPPWYVAENGFLFNNDVPRSAAGLNRVDSLLNINLFKTIYTRNSNVFAAMPSLHSAYPLVALLYAFHSRNRFWIYLFSVTSVGIWLAAVYTNHHYILDVVAGVSVAVFGYWIYEIGTRILGIGHRFHGK